MVAQLDDDTRLSTADPPPIDVRLTCPCGEVLEGCDGDELLTAVEDHIDAVHTTDSPAPEPTSDPQTLRPQAVLAAAGISRSGTA